ncbi:MAG: radical SAM protein, partial [Thermoplasmata archaeon]|nr:radical SAM protein [Thermoplasmata archaeon]
MRYDYPVYRPPSEASSLIIQTTIGCPHNKCRFCFMYKAKKFSIRKLADIKDDIASARMFNGENVDTIFLADGNSIIMKTPQLLEIINFCYPMFPN